MGGVNSNSTGVTSAQTSVLPNLGIIDGGSILNQEGGGRSPNEKTKLAEKSSVNKPNQLSIGQRKGVPVNRTTGKVFKTSEKAIAKK